jgi:hypothetical protein
MGEGEVVNTLAKSIPIAKRVPRLFRHKRRVLVEPSM